MATFQVGKEIDIPARADAGGFQVDTLIDHNENNVTNRIDVGMIFQNDDHLKSYLSTIFSIPVSEIDIIEL